jgi:hypothetical protein
LFHEGVLVIDIFKFYLDCGGERRQLMSPFILDSGMMGL